MYSSVSSFLSFVFVMKLILQMLIYICFPAYFGNFYVTLYVTALSTSFGDTSFIFPLSQSSLENLLGVVFVK